MGWLRVESDIRQERDAQDRKWGEQNHPDGTREEWTEGADNARHRCKSAFAAGTGTWEHVLTEEVCEAYAETNPAKLRVELVQCAAVIVAWIEAIDRRTAAAKAELSDDDALRLAGRLFPANAGATFPDEVTE